MLCHGITQSSGLEGTSRDHLVQPSETFPFFFICNKCHFGLKVPILSMETEEVSMGERPHRAHLCSLARHVANSPGELVLKL